MMCRTLLVMGFLLVSVTIANGQTDRYELGRRLRGFERNWETTKEPERKTAAAKKMTQAVNLFFSFKLKDAGKVITEGDLLLKGEQVTEETLAAHSLFCKPERRLWDPEAKKSMPMNLQAFFPSKSVIEKVPYQVRLLAGSKVVLEQKGTAEKFPAIVELDGLEKVADGDYTLEVTFETAKKVTTSLGISLVRKLSSRLEKVRTFLDARKEEKGNIDLLTTRHLLGTLDRLVQYDCLETDYPGNRLLLELEELTASIEKKSSYYSAKKEGQYWLQVPTTSRGGVVVRVQLPDLAKLKEKRPVVLALHGAGGSENLFFDSYGDGKVAKLATERDWFVVAPRSGAGFLTKPGGAAEIIDVLSEVYPQMDKSKVYMVGHSMGAGEAIREANTTPGRFAAVAALGGGGQPGPKADVKVSFNKLPFFVSVGSDDFAITGSRRLKDALKKIGVGQVEYQELKGIEHMIIVQEALPAVFKFFAEGK